MCSAPQNSGTSVMSTVPPLRTSRSAARPSAGLAERPEKPSEPPHFTPSDSSSMAGLGARDVVDHGQHRRHFLQAAVDHRLRAADLLDAEPDDGPSRSMCSCCRYFSTAVRFVFSQPRPMKITPPTFGCVA